MLVCDRFILLLFIILMILFLFFGIRAMYFAYKYETHLYKKYPQRIKELSIAAMFAYDNVKFLDTYVHLFGSINCDDPMLLLFRKKVRWSYFWVFFIWLSGLVLILTLGLLR